MKKYIFVALLAVSPLFVAAQEGGSAASLIIRMTKNGFEPKELTIYKGDEVTFVNEDTRDRRPASNNHPGHELYPAFDPQRSIKPKDMWIFVFEKPGTWGMHDHLYPNITGAITVLDNEADEGKPVDLNEKQGGFWNKLKELFAPILKLLGF